MRKVLLLKGLPASGKTTYAKELVAKGGWVRTNKDDLRAMLHSSRWSKSNEKFILGVRDWVIQLAMLKGLNIVVDDTNLHLKHERDIMAQISFFNNHTLSTSTEPLEKYTLEIKMFDITVEEAIRRDLQRPNSVGEKVIRGMYKDFLQEKLPQYVPDITKPKAIICDIDGTLAHMNGRGPYDDSLVHTDTLDEVVFEIVQRYWKDNYDIIICSGRSDACREVTEKWLEDKDIKYTKLLMRQAGDKRNDSIVKQEIFDNHIRNNFNVVFVLDDRNRVVEQWRANGLKVLQVADGDF